MKLLFDQNISFRIVNKVDDYFPGSKQVRQIGLDGASDAKIWEYAKANDFTIVTFDSDFFDFSILKGIPPKVIWLRSGNTTTNKVAEIIKKESDMIRGFISDTDTENKFCLELYS